MISTAVKSILSLSEAAAYTDYSKSRMYDAVRNRELSFYKPHGRTGKIFFERADLDEWRLQNKVQAKQTA